MNDENIFFKNLLLICSIILNFFLQCYAFIIDTFKSTIFKKKTSQLPQGTTCITSQYTFGDEKELKNDALEFLISCLTFTKVRKALKKDT